MRMGTRGSQYDLLVLCCDVSASSTADFWLLLTLMLLLASIYVTPCCRMFAG